MCRNEKSSSSSSKAHKSNPRKTKNSDSVLTEDNGGISQPIGLQNLGNTCFLNSVIQALSTVPLKECLDTAEGPVSEALYNTLRKTTNGSVTSYRPMELLSALGDKFPWYKTRRQQDAHEVLRILLGSMEDECGRNGIPTQKVQDLFGGEYINIILCLKCKHLRSIREEFKDLSLNIDPQKQQADAVEELLGQLEDEEEISVVDMKAQRRASVAQAYVEKLINSALKPQHLTIKASRKTNAEKWGMRYDPSSPEKKVLIVNDASESPSFSGVPPQSKVVEVDGVTDFGGIRHLLRENTDVEAKFELPFEKFKRKSDQPQETKGTKLRINLNKLFPTSEVVWPASKFSFDDSLRQFTDAEALVDDNQYRCDICKERTDALRRTILIRRQVPPVLSLQLNRFATSSLTVRGKNKRQLDLPTEFNLQCGLNESEDGIEDAADEPFLRAIGIDSANDEELRSRTQYELRAFVVHLGSTLSSGHYVAYVKKKQANGEDVWFLASDSSISQVDDPPFGDAYVATYMIKDGETK